MKFRSIKPIKDLKDYHRIMTIWENIDLIVPLSRVREIEAIARSRIDNALDKYNSNSIFYWSGGKDSLALEGLFRYRPSIKGYFFMESEDFVFTDMVKWYKSFTPERVYTDNGGWGFETIKERPNILFPHDQKTYSIWDKNKWKFQNAFRRSNEIKLVFTGRRIGDGNYCGKNGVKESKGYTTINPIYDWTCEDVFAYMKYCDSDLPPCYYLHDKGFEYGTSPWAKIKFKTKNSGWDWLKSTDIDAYNKACSAIGLNKEL